MIVAQRYADQLSWHSPGDTPTTRVFSGDVSGKQDRRNSDPLLHTPLCQMYTLHTPTVKLQKWAGKRSWWLLLQTNNSETQN